MKAMTLEVWLAWMRSQYETVHSASLDCVYCDDMGRLNYDEARRVEIALRELEDLKKEQDDV